jgi:hypothetical protein
MIVIGLSASAALADDGHETDKQGKATTAITSTEQAVERALAYGGFEGHVPYTRLAEDKVQTIQLSDSTTPFLSRFASGESVWRVQFDDVRLGHGDDNGKTYGFTVFVDSASGALLKIEGLFAEFDSTITPIILAADAERQIEGDGERYLGIPSEIPLYGFLSAVKACPYSMSGARRLVAQFVQHSQGYMAMSDSTIRFTEMTPCWVIALEGIPPIEPIGGSADWLPIYARNRIRQVVNATTGKIRSSSTRPQVKISPEDRLRIFGPKEE